MRDSIMKTIVCPGIVHSRRVVIAISGMSAFSDLIGIIAISVIKV